MEIVSQSLVSPARSGLSSHLPKAPLVLSPSPERYDPHRWLAGRRMWRKMICISHQVPTRLFCASSGLHMSTGPVLPKSFQPGKVRVYVHQTDYCRMCDRNMRTCLRTAGRDHHHDSAQPFGMLIESRGSTCIIYPCFKQRTTSSTIYCTVVVLCLRPSLPTL